GEWIIEREMTMISKDGTIFKFPEYHSSEEEEPTKQPRSLNKYGFVEHPQLQIGNKMDGFAPHLLPQQEGNMNGWLIEDDDELERNEADADEEEEEEPMEEEEVKEDSEKKRSKEASETGSNSESPGYAAIDDEKWLHPAEVVLATSGIATIITLQLQNILPQIATQVTNNVNNANGGNGRNGGKNGCSYKGFMACNPKEYDGNRGAIALTRWIEKIENVIDNSGCSKNQKVKYDASSFVNKALTWWNIQVQARGHEATIGMSWTNFKALLIEEFCPSNEMEKLETEFWNHKMVGANHAGYTDRFHELAKLVSHLVTHESSRIKRVGILTDEAINCGTLTKGNKKRKGVEETSKQGGWGNDNKRAKVSKGFVAATPHRNGYDGSHPKCAKCWTHHPEGGPCQVCFNCQKLAPGQVGNRLTIEGNQNIRNNGNQSKGRDFNVNAVGALQDPNVMTGTFSPRSF
ncbi:putative reverse transcriptase domain-containing protein, partial [Tanacetum coccineum]